MLDADADQQEINFAYDHILQRILRTIILKLNMQTVFNTYFHPDGRIQLCLITHASNTEIKLLHYVATVLFLNSDTQIISQPDIYPIISLIRLFNALKLKGIYTFQLQTSSRFQLLDNVAEFVT